LITVTIRHKDGRQETALLAGVPRRGEHVQLADGVSAPLYVVEGVLWMKGSPHDPEPDVVIVVSPQAQGLH